MATQTEILHIVDSVAIALKQRNIAPGPVGLLATTGVVRSEIYMQRLKQYGYSLMVPDEHRQNAEVMAGIKAVKAGQISTAKPLLMAALAELLACGAQAVILGCTEIPLALEGWSGLDKLPVVNSTEALASNCIAHSFKQNSISIQAETGRLHGDEVA